jgi:hypothetical protein
MPISRRIALDALLRRTMNGLKMLAKMFSGRAIRRAVPSDLLIA